MTRYALARGAGFDAKGRPLLALAETAESKIWLAHVPAVLTDIVVAAEAVPPEPKDAHRLFGTRESQEADPDSEESIRRAAADGAWIILLDARGMPDGEEGMRLTAPQAFLPEAVFDPLSSAPVALLCEKEIARHLGKTWPDHGTFAFPPMGAEVLEHHVAEERASQEPDEAIVWIRRDGLAICAAWRGGYLFWRAREFGPEARDCGFEPSRLPAATGFHFFSGKPWVDHGSPANDYEYDDGIDGTFEPLVDEHLARFGVTWESLREEVREYEEELEHAEDSTASSVPA